MTRGAQAERTGAIVVFYHPDDACVARANRLAVKTRCVVIDNTPGQYAVAGLDPSVHYVPNGENVGVATALNQGVAALREMGCAHALLFDQDSEPQDQLIEQLPIVLAGLLARGECVALVAPAYDDARLGGVAPFVRFRPFSLKRVAASGTSPIDVDFVITSGSCIALDCWADVGPMDDALFIDFVDLEWCIRAKRAGYRLLGVPWITMAHELGGEPVRIFGRPYPMHSPLRHYYLFRNAVALFGRAYVPWSWKSTEMVKFPVRLMIYLFLPSERSQHLRMAFRGMWDGLCGRLGSFADLHGRQRGK
nr:glycosyltransferase family 2 protein [Paraburkholderia sp. J67]